MAGTGPWVAQANVEPIAAVTIQALANSALYNTISGCAGTYSGANLNVTIASGSITHNGTATTVAGAAVTLVADATNPRWSYIYLDNTGAPAIVSGTAAATPAVPDPGANVTNQLVYVQAGLTIASNATYKLDKRVMGVNAAVALAGSSSAATSTTSTSAVDLVTISGLSIAVGTPFRVEWNGRKQALAANSVGFGIKANSTIIVDAIGGVTGYGSSATNQAEDGQMVFGCGVRATNYLNPFYGFGTWHVSASGAGAGTQGFSGSWSNPMPNATVTSIAVRAINATASNAVETTSVRILTGIA